VKSIRPVNLHPLYATPPSPAPADVQPPRQQDAAPQAATTATTPPEASTADVDGPQQTINRAELESLARALLASTGQPDADQVLSALPDMDLMELIASLSEEDPSSARQGQQSHEKHDRRDPEQHDKHDLQQDRDQHQDVHAGFEASGMEQETTGASGASSSSAHWPRESREPSGQDMAEKEFELQIEEARLRSMAEVQSKRAEALEAREAALREAEEALERRKADREAKEKGGDPPSDEAPSVPVRVPFVQEEASPAASPSAALEAERAELQRLREEIDEAAKDLEARQLAAKKAAEERELQFLEEESEQMRLASLLKEEEARLAMQRRSLGMLQQAMLKGGAESRPEGSGGYVELSMNDSGVEDGHADAPAAAQSTGEGVEKEDDEVWDLDWSAVRPEQAGHSDLAPS